MKYIFGFITAVSLILLAAFVSLRLESVQHTLAKKVSEELSVSYGIPTEITAIEIYSINEIRLKGVLVKDLQGDTLLHANEAQAHLNTTLLFDGLIRINTIGLGAGDIRLNRATADAPLNAQFIIDIINGNKKEDKNPKIDLRINQVSVYDGKVAYDVLDTAADSTVFDKNHIAVKGLDCNISLKKLNSEELELDVRSIHAEEKCGFMLKELSGRVEMKEKVLHLNGFDIKTGKSHISSESISIDLNNGLKDVSMRGNVKCHVLSPDDYAPFTDVQLRILPSISFNADGFYSKDSINAAITARTHSNDFNIKGHAALKAPLSSTRKGEVVIEECNASNDIVKQAIEFAGLKDIGYDIPGKLGDIFTNGMLTFHSDSINGDIELACKSGHFFVSGMVDTLGTYRAHINGMDLQLYDLTEIQSLRRCDITADMSGNWNDADNYLNVGAVVNDLVFNSYTYSPITLQGEYNRNSITANISTDDPNASLLVDATYNRNSNKKLKLMLTAGTFRPKRLNLIKTDKEQDFAFSLVGDYFDQGDGSRIINANINNLKYADEADTTYVNNIFFSDSKSTDERLFVLSSDFAQASIYGHFDAPSLFNSFVGILRSHLPVLGIAPNSTDDGKHNNSFYYDISITDGKPLAHFLDIPIAINEESKIKGMFDDRERQFSIDARINNLAFGGRRFRSLSIDGKSSDKYVDLKAQILKPTVTDPKTFKYEDTADDVVIRVNANISKDMIKGVVNWNNFKKNEPLMGMVRVDAGLFRDDNGELNLEAKIHNDSIIHNNQIWHITEGSISGNTNRLTAKNISLYNDEQSLCIEGIAGKSASDSLNVDVKNFELATIFDIINFKILSFGGKATGTAHVTGILSDPNAGGRFEVEGFKIDGGKMGRGDIYAGWDNKTKSIVLNADVYNEANAKSNVSGFLSQANDTITLMIDANDLNLNFLNKKLKSFVVNTRGTATGKVHLHGSWRAVNFDGAAAMHCSTTVKATNVRYHFTGDSMKFYKGTMEFANTKVYDRHGNQGMLSGKLLHKNLSNWKCDLHATVKNALAYDTEDFSSLPFYGSVYGDGYAIIKSDENGFYLKADVTTSPNSHFVYNANETSGARDNSFITFTDNSKKSKERTSAAQTKTETTKPKKSSGNMTLDFILNTNENLELKVYTNVQNDDYISIYGNGTINAEYVHGAGFNMKGHLDLERGFYKFTIQDIFPKIFEISKGSTIAFNGDPYKADLKLHTKYLVPSASLSDLTTEVATRKTVKVNCIMDVTGSLESPELAFDLELPEGSEEERELLASVANTPDQKNMQFIYLLGIGKFYSIDSNYAQSNDTNSSTAVESLISNTVSGQLNNMLGKIIDNDNWNLSGNISTSERGWNSMEVEGMIRGRMFNNRLLINGNLGYRENPIANRNVIGDFEVQWLLNPLNNWSVKAYSKTNDRYFSKTDLTTQGIGTSVRFDFDSWKWWKRRKEEEVLESETGK